MQSCSQLGYKCLRICDLYFPCSIWSRPAPDSMCFSITYGDAVADSSYSQSHCLLTHVLVYVALQCVLLKLFCLDLICCNCMMVIPCCKCLLWYLKVAERIGSYVVPISWQPASAEDLMHMVWIVCDQVWRRDLRKSYGDELRAQYAVQHRLESMGATTKTEGVLKLIYPHYKYMSEGTTRSHYRFDMLVTMGNFKVCFKHCPHASQTATVLQ